MYYAVQRINPEVAQAVVSPVVSLIPASLLSSFNKRDLAALRKSVTDVIADDSNMGPTFIRLAWHSAGTYSKSAANGGSAGGHIRLRPERDYGANKGLDKAMKALEAVKAAHPWISYADLYTFAGVVAVEEMGGPKIAWRWGRLDNPTGGVEDGRLPSADRGSPKATTAHVRDIFSRMGFNDREIVALIGAHAVGFCHSENSGYKGPWTHDPYGFTNSYFIELLNNKWDAVRNENGLLQFSDAKTKTLMMLPGDMIFIQDPVFRAIVEEYAADDDAWQHDFSLAFAKLLELGCTNLHTVQDL